MAKIYLFCLLLFQFTAALPSDYHRTINWQVPPVVGGNQLKSDFDGSTLVDETNLPYWFESFEVETRNLTVVIKDPVFETMNDSLLSLKIIENEELKYSSEVAKSASQYFMKLTVFPFIKKDGHIQRLVSFSYSVEPEVSTLKSATAAFNWKQNSVLASGKWVKVSVKARGIYKITYDQLQQWGFQNPDQVAMYGNGGYKLPVSNKDTKVDDLSLYPVWKGKDNSGKNCLFFYSTGNISFVEDTKTGKYSHQQNPYATETYFYLTDLGNLKLIVKADAVAGEPNNTVTSFPNYVFYEKETANLLASGSRWFGEYFRAGTSQAISVTLENVDSASPVQFKVSAVGKSSSTTSMSITVNGKAGGNMSFQPVDIGNVESRYADDRSSEFSASISSPSVQLRLNYNASNSSSEAWLDYISVNYLSQLSINSDVYQFRGKGVLGTALISEYVLSNANSSTKIFDVTDINQIFEVPSEFSNGQLRFKTNSAVTREYVAFNPAGSIPTVDSESDVANQNLHGTEAPEMIIIANQKLLNAANDLAEFRRTNDRMTVSVITPDLIYNEFSGGLPDPAGLRNFFRMYYDRGTQSGARTFKYILLMGDGSYDNRNILGHKFNLLPTYQSDESLSPVTSFVSDDFFVFLDENEGGATGTVDLGIGRIPANTVADAEAVVGKIKHYHETETFGNWRNIVTFIADDGNLADRYSNQHASQAETLASNVNRNYPSFYTDKIYFDSYKKISSAGGEKYPEVATAISNRVKQGTLVMNYTGHANERNLADEAVLDIGTINSWSNYNRLPIFVTATCEYSRYDADETTAGEYILFNPSGGGVGLFSTTRVVYSTSNATLNTKFFDYIFEKDELGNNYRMGDVMRLAKASSNTGINQLNFSLLADPAMRLANPEYSVQTTSINGKDVNVETDTIRSLSLVTVKGFIAGADGNKIDSFNGEIIPTVYDKAMRVETLGNSGQSPISYAVQNNVLYKGLATVKNGAFEFTFFVPKDISFKLDKGKILYYAYNETHDANGYFTDFYIGGTSSSTVADTNGPEIDLYMNSRSFEDGGTVSASSVLLADISDETGVNTAGTGIGHDITAVLDGDNANVMVLNDYFQADKDSYTSGKIVFPLNNLSEGEHVLKVKVWDVVNNSSEKEIRFYVKDDFRIESVTCYPNPVQDETHFVFTHNQPDESMDITLEVFETSGVRVDMLTTKIGSVGTESLPLEWTPANRHVKMRPGVYIYRVSATSGGKSASGSGRLVYVYR